MTLLDLPPHLLAGTTCFHAVQLDACPPAVTLRLYAVPAGEPDARLELARWRHEFADGGDFGRLIVKYLENRERWPVVAEWFDAYAGELLGIPGDLRPVVGETFRRQRERYEASFPNRGPDR